MKTYLSIVLLLCGTAVFAQNDDHRQHDRDRHDKTPQSVREGFRKEHPDRDDAQWSQTNGRWHARYKDNDHNRDDYYDNRGRRTYTRIDWDRKNLPGDYDTRIRNRYHTTDYRVTRIERPNNPSLFELILNIGGRNRTVYTDESGNEVRYYPR